MAKMMIVRVSILLAVVAMVYGVRISSNMAEDENRWDEQGNYEDDRCQIEFEVHVELKPCWEYLQLNNPWPDDKNQCCTELQFMDERCRCGAIKKMFKQGYKTETKDSHQFTKLVKKVIKANELTRLCNVQPDYCHVLD